MAHKRAIAEYKRRKAFMEANKNHPLDCLLYDKVNMTGFYFLDRTTGPWYKHYL